MSDTEQLAKLRELLEKSTQGKEFTPRLFDEAQAVVVVDQKRVIATFFGPEFVWNAHLFAALRNEFPAILTILEAERQERERAFNGLSIEQATKLFQAMLSVSLGRVKELSADERNLFTDARLQEAEARASRAEQATKEALEQRRKSDFGIIFRADHTESPVRQADLNRQALGKLEATLALEEACEEIDTAAADADATIAASANRIIELESALAAERERVIEECAENLKLQAAEFLHNSQSQKVLVRAAQLLRALATGERTKP